MSFQVSLSQTDTNSSSKRLKTESLFSRHNNIQDKVKSELTLASKTIAPTALQLHTNNQYTVSNISIDIYTNIYI